MAPSIRQKWGLPALPTQVKNAIGIGEPIVWQESKSVDVRGALIEDLDVVSNRAYLQSHDGNGVFRTDEEWAALFKEACPGFTLLRSGWQMKIVPHVPGPRSKIHAHYILGVTETPSNYQKWYVLERTPVVSESTVQ